MQNKLIKILAVSGLALGIINSFTPTVYANTSSKIAKTNSEDCKNKLQNFGDNLIKTISSKHNKNKKISKIQDTINELKIFDITKLAKKACGKDYYNNLIKINPNFNNIFIRYNIQAILDTIDTFTIDSSTKFSINKKQIVKGKTITFKCYIKTKNDEPKILNIIMDQKNKQINNVKVEGATSLVAILRSQFKDVISQRIRKSQSKSTDKIYKDFIEDIQNKLGDVHVN